MRSFVPQFRRFLPDQAGATAIEYAILAAGIAGVLVATVNTLGGNITAMFTSVAGIFH
jgi:pilus assembly protein Flp/PilA